MIINANPASIQNVLDNLPMVTAEDVVIRLRGGLYPPLRVPKGRWYAQRLVIEGPESLTAMIDGTGSALTGGVEIGPRTFATVANLRIRNCTRFGVLVTSGSNVWVRNCRVSRCGWVGIKAAKLVEIRVQGGRVNRCPVGLEAYGNTEFTFGYTQGVRIRNCATGVRAQNASQGHVDFCNITDTDTGIELVNQSRAHVKECNVEGSRRALWVRHSSTWFNNTNTITGPIVMGPNSSEATET